MRAERITRQQLVRMGDPAYVCTHRLPDDVRRAVWAILACRTARLGGPVQACPEGQRERFWSHACRQRRCPLYAWVQLDGWGATQKSRLVAYTPDQASGTMPHALTVLWRATVAVRCRRLWARVHDPLVELRGEGQDLGARPGIRVMRHP